MFQQQQDEIEQLTQIATFLRTAQSCHRDRARSSQKVETMEFNYEEFSDTNKKTLEHLVELTEQNGTCERGTGSDSL